MKEHGTSGVRWPPDSGRVGGFFCLFLLSEVHLLRSVLRDGGEWGSRSGGVGSGLLQLILFLWRALEKRTLFLFFFVVLLGGPRKTERRRTQGCAQRPGGGSWGLSDEFVGDRESEPTNVDQVHCRFYVQKLKVGNKDQERKRKVTEQGLCPRARGVAQVQTTCGAVWSGRLRACTLALL